MFCQILFARKQKWYCGSLRWLYRSWVKLCTHDRCPLVYSPRRTGSQNEMIVLYCLRRERFIFFLRSTMIRLFLYPFLTYDCSKGRIRIAAFILFDIFLSNLFYYDIINFITIKIIHLGSIWTASNIGLTCSRILLVFCQGEPSRNETMPCRWWYCILNCRMFADDVISPSYLFYFLRRIIIVFFPYHYFHILGLLGSQLYCLCVLFF